MPSRGKRTIIVYLSFSLARSDKTDAVTTSAPGGRAPGGGRVKLTARVPPPAAPRGGRTGRTARAAEPSVVAAAEPSQRPKRAAAGKK